MRLASARVIHQQRRRCQPRALADNIEAGKPIVAKAQQKNDALMIARELGIDIEPAEAPAPKRPVRKRTPNRNGPVTKTVLWSAVDPTTKLHALFLAGQDIKRCVPVSRFEVLVLNNPQRKAPR